MGQEWKVGMPITFDELLAIVGKHTALTDSEVESLCEQARRPEYWTSLCRETTISLTRPPAGPPEAPSPGIRAAISDYKKRGHCIVHDAFAMSDIERLRSAIFRVHEAGWPMIFAFIYDQFWTIIQSQQLNTFATALLGPGYQPTVSFWVNYVPAQGGSSGFPPHLDDVRPGHHAVTCWIPLTPATPDNGCVYVVERDSYGTPTALAGENIPILEVRKILTRARALLVSPGSFIAWPNDTLHWGGTFLRGEDRLALSYHLTSADYENIDSALRQALVPSQPLPSFARRLQWISESMLRFRTRDPLLERFAKVAYYFINECSAVEARVGESR
jgi:hypothetical protein